MQKPKLARWRVQTLHHKLMLILSFPIFLWVLSGCYFVWMDLGYIRGDHYQKPTVYISPDSVTLSFAQVIDHYPNANHIDLFMLADHPVYRVTQTQKTVLINAQNGEELHGISEQLAHKIAKSVMPESSIVKRSVALKEKAPDELASRHLPVWQVSFADAVNSTIYVSMNSGEIVTRRHDFWRIFDLLWRVHIMDYDDGANIANPLLLITTLCAIFAIFCGILWQFKWLKRGRI